jgi:hypothetical protein
MAATVVFAGVGPSRGGGGRDGLRGIRSPSPWTLVFRDGLIFQGGLLFQGLYFVGFPAAIKAEINISGKLLF